MAKRTIATILSMKDQFTAPAKKATKSVKNMNREMKRTQNQVKRFGREAKKQFVNVAKEAWKMAKTTVKIGAGMTAAIGALATKEGFSEAFNMEGYKVQLETATKDTKKASKLMANAVSFANKTPFETGAVVEATATMEMYSISSKRWLKDIADMAGATNKSIIQATEAMADASLGEFERLKEFGIRKDDIMLASAKKYGKGVVFNNKGQMLDQAKMMDVLQEMMQKKYKGGANKLSKTAKGLWSTVTGVTKNALAKIVGMNEDGTIKQMSLYDKLKTKIGSVAETLQRWQKDGTIDKIRTNVENVVNKISESLKFALEIVNNVKEGFGFWDGVAVPVLEKIDNLLFSTFSESTATMISNVFHIAFATIDKILTISKKLFKFITTNWDTIAPIIFTIVGAMAAYKAVTLAQLAYTKAITIAEAIKTGVLATGATTVNAITIAQWAWNAAMTANPIGVVIALIAALIAIGILVWKNWDTIKAKAFALWEGIKEAFSPIGKFFEGIWEGVKTGFKSFINFFIAGINKVISGVNSVKVKVPDWVPKYGGEEFGIKIPELPTFAKGGIATGPSIFGEAGAEMAIPLKKNNPRSQQLLSQADNIINGKKSKEKLTIIINFNGTTVGEEEFFIKAGNYIANKIETTLANMA
ncbi:hypothetical protein [Wukongibacter sp. M2B1]|uniref:hypothetical protein n=1 Tax=Wukongibacter sp. M2B1 TaxID=3088895 RepID=UPI003D7A6414